MKRAHRPVSAMDVAASALARVSPRVLRGRIEQARHDVNAVLGGFVGPREPSFTTRTVAPRRPLSLAEIDPLEHAMPRRLRAAYLTLRTDLRWLARDLRGERRPAVVTRGPSRYAARPAPIGIAPRPVRVVCVERETADAVTLHLVEADGRPLSFEAGQFLTFHLEVDGVLLRRAYSLSSSPLRGPGASVTVKRVVGGRASHFMNDRVGEGATLRVLGPSGSFLAPDPAAAPEELVMVAGGAGITPLRSIAETVLASQPDVSVRMIYGNRARADVIFAAHLDSLVEAHPSRMSVTHVLEEAPAGFRGPVGRLEPAVLAGWLDALPPARRVYYLCGPLPMMEGARALLLSRGVPGEDIREERFQSPTATGGGAAFLRAPTRVQLRVKGRDHIVPLAPGKTLLEAGIAAGAAMPFSCAMGGCAACKGRLVAGEVVMEEPNCLSPREREEGFVLTCCARPASDGVRVDVA